jgi:hypothetical protein
MNTAERVISELRTLGLSDDPGDPPNERDDGSAVTPPESADTSLGTDDPSDPSEVPAMQTDRGRAYRAAQGLGQTLKLLHQAAGQAMEACSSLCEALEGRAARQPDRAEDCVELPAELKPPEEDQFDDAEIP